MTLAAPGAVPNIPRLRNDMGMAGGGCRAALLYFLIFATIRFYAVQSFELRKCAPHVFHFVQDWLLLSAAF